MEKGEIKVSFLKIRQIDANYATANNMYQYWQDVVDIYSPDPNITLRCQLRGEARGKQLTQRIQLANRVSAS